jgi:hypothetical protein
MMDESTNESELFISEAFLGGPCLPMPSIVLQANKSFPLEYKNGMM